VTDLPAPYKTPGRTNGYTRESAWWAFNRLGTLAAQRWGDMRKDVDAKFVPMQQELFDKQKAFEDEVSKKMDQDPVQARKMLTEYTMQWGRRVVEEAWNLGDFLWTKYDEKF
jgi:dipeptidase